MVVRSSVITRLDMESTTSDTVAPLPSTNIIPGVRNVDSLDMFEYDIFNDDTDEDTLLNPVRKNTNKRRHSEIEIDRDQLLAARRRLFAEDVERPTQDTFYMEGEKINMTDPITCTIQREFFARIFNAMWYLSQCKLDGVQNSSMRSHTEIAKNKLAKLKNNNYENYHYVIPNAVSYILQGMEGIRCIKKEEFIVQLVPITCTLENELKDRLRVTGLELRQVNNSVSLSVNLNVDIKFLYAGQFSVRKIPDQGEKYYVAPTNCLGNYINEVVNELYDLVFERTKEYVDSFLKRFPERNDTVVPLQQDVYSDMESRNYQKKKSATNTKEDNDRNALTYLLRTVGRENNIKKVDLDRMNVFVLTSSIKTTPKYLKATSDLNCSISSTPVADADAVFLSSFVRARIMEDGSLNFQIYSRTCMYLSDNETFPA